MTTNPPVTVTYTLEDLFIRFEQNINEKIDRQSTEVKEQFAEVKEQLVKLEVGQAALAGEIKSINERLSGDIKAQDERLSGEIKSQNEKLSGEIKAVDERLSGDIKTLNATVAGIGKRVDNAEFFNRGVAIALVAAVFGGLIKWFGWFPIN